MDFKSLMSAQISKAKAPLKPEEPTKKYLKRSEVEAQRQAAYLAEQKAAEAARIEKLQQKRKHEEDEAERTRVREEKKRRLAEESSKRRELEAEEEERKRRKRLGLPELVKEEVKEEVKEVVEKKRVWEGSIPTTLEPVEEKDMKVDQLNVPGKDDIEGREFLFRQLASYFNMVLRAWEVALARRTEDVKASYQGKQAYNSMVLAKDNMKAMFRKMEAGELEQDILKPVVEIVHAAQERRYVDANDGYLRLSIGNAAWPIGVTMVGIHERSAREKLHDGDTAHIMSDETTRKYLQSIKRCLSFAQTRWPPDDQLQLMG
ncbi:hypothetical protein EJ05DRAFT_466114 [Pseudovirgaria hyperparasitica]|uniref:Pre-mRNA-splicing factor 18 n=1 Tax=Pseudovirgaria hyperparasitica TaxID=470096 RepID=A0A6A6W4B4_9PEZI|nr:uncharacterized protein EJ05DRAFT_466114 [Pseudovirgaria hyperparasitica]KAF2756874.1 hypothetical protein EJ05DRAFT_466114 [Pseudovirgaria hyperparasitica]